MLEQGTAGRDAISSTLPVQHPQPQLAAAAATSSHVLEGAPLLQVVQLPLVAPVEQELLEPAVRLDLCHPARQLGTRVLGHAQDILRAC